MKSKLLASAALAAAGIALAPLSASAHPGHGSMWSALYEHVVFGSDHDKAAAPRKEVAKRSPSEAVGYKGNTLTLLSEADTAATAAEKISGQGAYKFRVFATSSILPSEAGPVLVKAHGGFAVDKRPGKGDVYFALPGAGIIKLNPDLNSSVLIPTPDEVKNTNLHNALIWFAGDGTPYLAFPANDANKVFTLSLDGQLLHTLEPPTTVKFANEAVTKYFADGGKFVPTDVEELNGTYYIPTGYSALDYVLEAKVTPGAGLKAEWSDQAFGGKGSGPGQFGTGHGIAVSPDRDVISVADRPNSQIDRFKPVGEYIDTIELPKGSLPCDLAFESGLTVVGCLEGPDKTKGAPIYIVKDGQVVSTIVPREELGLSQFAHVHNATMTSVNGKLYIIAQAWNPGDFAVLEQVID